MALEDDEIVIEDLANIAKKVLEEIVPLDAYFMPDTVNTWCQQVMDQCLKEYSKLGKPYKYILTCFMMQRNGAGYQTATGCYWTTGSDGSTHVVGDYPHLNCLITIYAAHV